MIVLVNGASSSGKTSLCRELQQRWPSPLVYCSIDQVIANLPFAYTGQGTHAQLGFGVQGSEIQVGEHGYAVNLAEVVRIQHLHEQNYDIVVDYVMLDERLFAAFVEGLREYPLYFVGLFCAPEQLAERNINRDDRIAGLSLAQQQSVHFCRASYDLELSSSDHTAAELADLVLAGLSAVPATTGIKL